MESKMTNMLRTRQLQGGWLLLARGVWIIFTLLSIGILIAAAIGLYTGWRKPCSAFPLNDRAFCVAEEQALHQLGLSHDFYAVYFSTAVLVEVLPWILVGILVFSRKSHEPFGLFFSLMLVVSGTVAFDSGITTIVLTNYPTFGVPLDFVQFIGGELLILWYLYPDGHFAPRWTRWLAMLWVVLTFFVYYFPDSPLNYELWPEPLPRGIVILFAASIVYSLAYRYRRVANRVQRQQIKWITLSVSIFALVYISGVFLYPAFALQPNTSRVLYYLTYQPFFYLSIMLVGVSLGFAILRYRLWDIDFYINRTLVYAAVTVILALIWIISLGLLRFLFEQYSSQPSAWVAAVLSSFEAVALFRPIRDRVEKWINKRFYKDRVDFNEAIIEIQPEKWQYSSSKGIFELLVTKTPHLIKSTRSAIYYLDDKGFHLKSTTGIEAKEARKFQIDERSLATLKSGQVAILEEGAFVLLVPLVIPRHHSKDLIGVLALGPRFEDRGYSRDHITDLTSLGEKAGIAIYFMQLNERKKKS
jgi:hypothetical protein